MPARANVLIVEPNDVARRALQLAVSGLADVDLHGQFDTARVRLAAGSFDFIVTNIRLGPYNGLHLAYVSALGARPPRVIVYSDLREPGLAREAQRAGAFYEVTESLMIALASYLKGTLPDHDRRDPTSVDRRSTGRGGRRSWDEHLIGRIG